jgi:hypothetical protein
MHLKYVNSTLFILEHPYTFQPPRDIPQGVLITFCEQGQQNMCPDVNIRLKGSVLYVTWQFYSYIWKRISSTWPMQ